MFEFNSSKNRLSFENIHFAKFFKREFLQLFWSKTFMIFNSKIRNIFTEKSLKFLN